MDHTAVWVDHQEVLDASAGYTGARQVQLLEPEVHQTPESIVSDQIIAPRDKHLQLGRVVLHVVVKPHTFAMAVLYMNTRVQSYITSPQVLVIHGRQSHASKLFSLCTRCPLYILFSCGVRRRFGFWFCVTGIVRNLPAHGTLTWYVDGDVVVKATWTWRCLLAAGGLVRGG